MFHYDLASRRKARTRNRVAALVRKRKFLSLALRQIFDALLQRPASRFERPLPVLEFPAPWSVEVQPDDYVVRDTNPAAAPGGVNATKASLVVTESYARPHVEC